MKIPFLYTLVFLVAQIAPASGQIYDPDDIRPDTTFDNILVKHMYSDSLSSGFIIWVKKEVPAHRHNHHTEVVTIIDGTAEFVLGDERKTVERGDIIIIPQGTVHSVITTSAVPLKVLSVQSPLFDGSDREKIY